MKVRHLHSWQLGHQQASALQRELAGQLILQNELDSPQLIAGTDISAPDQEGIATGAVVVLNFPELSLVETQLVRNKVEFPYIPGLLSFREAPLVLEACEKLIHSPDLFLIDGQGIAHPRRFGLASHLGILLNTPAIGCAKSRLWGKHEPVAEEPGSFSYLKDGPEVIGAVLRTKERTKPIYVSIGYKVDLETAIKWVLNCCRGYRIPEPTRLAHLAASGQLENKIANKYQGKLL
jgi:deoxyribonuclease V